jgi:hypothetical protein
MPSGPTLFDDGDGRGPDEAPKHPERDVDDDRSSDGPRRSGRGPNYLFRRAVVVGGVVAVLATASIVVGRLIGSGSDGSASGAISAEWNRVVLVDDRTGRVVVDDADGEELGRVDSGVRNPTASAVVDSTVVVAGDDVVAVIDIGDDDIGSDDAVEFDLGAGSIVRPAGSALTMVAPRPDGGRGLLVHGPSGETIDTDAFAPVVGARYEFPDARAAGSGRDVLVTDSGNFQSVLFSFDRDQPSFFPGLALAVDADLVVTAQNVGSDATINVFDHDGEPVSTGRTASVRAGMITGSTVVLVTVDGAVVTMSSSDGAISDEAQLDIGTIQSGAVMTTGDRLIVTGAAGTAIVGENAELIATYDAQRPAGDGSSPIESTCLTTVDAGDVTEPRIAVIEATDGSVLVEAVGAEPLVADASGCIVGAATADGFDLLSSDGVRRFTDDDTLLALSLDGEVVAAERDGRVVLLATGLDDEASQQSIDLGPQGRSVHFTQS